MVIPSEARNRLSVIPAIVQQESRVVLFSICHPRPDRGSSVFSLCRGASHGGPFFFVHHTLSHWERAG